MNNGGVIPSTAAVPGRDSSLCQLTEKMVNTSRCWPGAVTVPLNPCCIVLVVQQLQPTSVKPEGSSQQRWEEKEACPGSPVPLQDRLHSLAEAERLLDELTQEKMQVGRVQCEPNCITRHCCNQHTIQGFPAVRFDSSLTIHHD